jgi:hypothetical protein
LPEHLKDTNADRMINVKRDFKKYDVRWKGFTCLLDRILGQTLMNTVMKL